MAASNIVVEGREPIGHDELLRRVGTVSTRTHLLHLPINGPRAGDSRVPWWPILISSRRSIVAPLKANVLRINDNIATFLNNVVGVTKDVKGTIVWAADEVVYAPEIAVSDVRVDAIAENQEDQA